MKIQGVKEQRQEEEVGLQEECWGRAALTAQPRDRDCDGVGGSTQGHQGHHHGQVRGEADLLKICDMKYIVGP